MTRRSHNKKLHSHSMATFNREIFSFQRATLTTRLSDFLSSSGPGSRRHFPPSVRSIAVGQSTFTPTRAKFETSVAIATYLVIYPSSPYQGFSCLSAYSHAQFVSVSCKGRPQEIGFSSLDYFGFDITHTYLLLNVVTLLVS